MQLILIKSETDESIELLESLREKNKKLLDEIYSLDVLIKSTMSELIEMHTELWRLYNVLNGELKWLANMFGLSVESEPDIIEENPLIHQPVKNKENNPDCKVLFQKISTLTHPDKIKDIKLNEHFITAKKLYNKKDLSGLIDLYNSILGKYDEDILKESIKKQKQEIEKNIEKLTILQTSEDYNISTKFRNEKTKSEAEHLFIAKITRIINSTASQIADLKSKTGVN